MQHYLIRSIFSALKACSQGLHPGIILCFTECWWLLTLHRIIPRKARMLPGTKVESTGIWGHFPSHKISSTPWDQEQWRLLVSGFLGWRMSFPKVSYFEMVVSATWYSLLCKWETLGEPNIQAVIQWRAKIMHAPEIPTSPYSVRLL